MSGKALISHYFPEISPTQLDQLQRYAELLVQKNQSVNVISRKNEHRVWEDHILHSLSIAKVNSFESGAKVLDFGTGGGLPGIPLAIVFPEAQFLLVDSIGKKVRVVQEMVEELGLQNVRTQHIRVEELQETFDFAVSRAVTALPRIQGWLKGKVKPGKNHSLANGLIYIKGGDFEDELLDLGVNFRLWEIQEWFEDPFFETKKVVWIDLAR